MRNQAAEYATELFASMSPGMRFMVVLLMLAVLVGFGFLFVLHGGGGNNYLLGGRTFNATEIIAAQAAFAKGNLTGAKVEGNRIRVPGSQETAYVAAMADANVLPSDFHLILDQTLDKISPFMPPKQRDEFVKNARQRRDRGRKSNAASPTSDARWQTCTGTRPSARGDQNRISVSPAMAKPRTVRSILT